MTAIHSASSAAPVAPRPGAGATGRPRTDLRPERPREYSFQSADEADRLAVALKSGTDRIAISLARVAAAFVRRRAWHVYGFARLDDFGVEMLDRSGRWLRELAALGGALERLPRLRASLTGEDGGAPLGRVAATWIARVASRESLPAWVALARGTTVRHLRGAIRATREAGSAWPPGAAPAGNPEDPSPGNGKYPDGAGRSAPGEEPPIEDVPVERHLVRLSMPPAVRTAFDETRDLHRAVVGSESTVGSFLDALTAESIASGWTPDDRIAPCRRGPSRVRREEELGRATGNWEQLAPTRGFGRWMEILCPELRALGELEQRAGDGRAEDLVEQLAALIHLDERLRVQLGEVLAAMSDSRMWSGLRFTDAGHYAEERLRIARSTAEKRVRLARALRSLPKLRRAHDAGWVGFESAQLVVRAIGREPVPAEAERAWVNEALCATVKRVRDAVAIRSCFPTSPGEGIPPLPPDDAAWHASLRREPGRTRTRVRKLANQALAKPFADVFLRLRLTEEGARTFVAAVEARRRGLAEEAREAAGTPSRDDTRGGAAPESGGPRDPAPPDDLAASTRIARSFSRTGRVLPDWVGLLAMLEDYADTWDDPRGMPRRAGDAIYIRDGWRCAAPGCTSRRNLEDHHVRYRSRGGSDDTSNRICLCRFHHHQGEHGELATVEGTAPLGLTFRLGRADVGQWFRNERRLERNPGVSAFSRPGARFLGGAATSVR